MKKLNIDFAYRVMHSIKRPNASPLPTIFSSVTPCIAGLTLLLVITGAPARAQVPGGVEQFTLANGLTVIPKPDPRAPTLAQMLWERVGSIDEVNGTSGVAHAREHMMFKGTAMLKPGEFSRRVAALGGRENAFTGRDNTGYYQQIPANKLEDVMRLESDRFATHQWADDEGRAPHAHRRLATRADV